MRASSMSGSTTCRRYVQASATESAAPSLAASALAGIHTNPPDVAEVPPQWAAFSQTTTLCPAAAATSAAVMPPAPEPMTSTSVPTAVVTTPVLLI